MLFRSQHKLETRIVRIFNTYGPRMRLKDGRVVPAFVSQALRNEPITVFGEGKQTRSFCYCSDLIEGIYRLMMSDYPLPVNIGNPREMTMLEFAHEIIRATGAKSKEPPMLEVENLEAGYGPIRALDRVSLEVAAGELVAIIGANGAGKTTKNPLHAIYSAIVGDFSIFTQNSKHGYSS